MKFEKKLTVFYYRTKAIFIMNAALPSLSLILN